MILFKVLLCDSSKGWKLSESGRGTTSNTATGMWRMLQKNLETKKQDMYDRDENFDFLS
jgi:hypothetical protein